MFFGYYNYSGLRYRDTCRVINSTRLNPYASRLTAVLEGVTGSHVVSNETIPALYSNPYGIRLQGGSAGVTKLFRLFAGNGGFDTRLDIHAKAVEPEAGGQRSGHTAAGDAASCLCCEVATDLPDLLPRRRNAAVEVLPESGKSGQDAVQVEAEGDKRPSEKPLLTLNLTAEQLRDLAFAVYCQVVEIQYGDEANHPEVLPVIRRLNEVSAMCIELEKGALS